ncbi:MAG TPA: hypothetical protein DGP39_09345, partial [Verrucomicrobiales bacterium]|nr:hypothetical protein [Verrucomicrobiales bacterium]
MVLWADPQQRVFEAPQDANGSDAVNASSERVEAAFSADGAKMVLTRWSKDFEEDANGTGADLYLSEWNGRVWSKPRALAALNTASNERAGSFTRDGRYLIFSSDRAGGAGGYDLYA